MLTQLAIKNFKAWRDTGNIRLAPITVFFGSNSAGKTSLLQFLLMLRQSAESRDRKQVFHPGDETTDVDLGTYRDLVYRHETKRQIEFSLAWTLPEGMEVGDVLTGKKYRGNDLQFEAEVLSGDAARQAIGSLRYTLGDPASGGLSVDMRREGPSNYAVTAIPYQLVRNQGRAWTLPEPLRFYGFPDEVLAYFQNAGFTSELVLGLEQQLRRIKYLGPLRQRPRRTYTWSGVAPDTVGFDGRSSIPAILASQGRSISRGRNKRAESFLGITARWLKELGLLDNFDPKALAKASKQYEIVVEAVSGGVETNLPDVGFGVSQVLPVIVECFYAGPESTIVIEQPELHLHPRVQAYLANLFVETIRAREDGKDRKVQLLIESHSEHFIYRLQRLIAEEVVGPEDVALYFCRAGSNGSLIEPLELNEDGDIVNWPKDFFGDEMDDVRVRLAAAAARARKA
jgi:predicted ATPase